MSHDIEQERILRMVLATYGMVPGTEPRQVQWIAAKRHADELIAAGDNSGARVMMAIADLSSPERSSCCSAPDVVLANFADLSLAEFIAAAKRLEARDRLTSLFSPISGNTLRTVVATGHDLAEASSPVMRKPDPNGWLETPLGRQTIS